MSQPSIFTQHTIKRNRNLIKNKNILQSTFIPNQLPHREREINMIAEIVAPALEKDKPSNILVTGRPGTGKTAVLNFIGREIKKVDPNEENCCFVYINCEIVDAPTSMLYNMSNQVIKEHERKIPFTGWSFDKVYETLLSYMEESHKTYLVVLDEIDMALQKKGDDIFYYLTNMNETLSKSRVSVIGITNNTKFIEFLSTKIKSRLGEEKIIFTPYTPDQIKDILRERAAVAFEDGILEESVIPFCAAVAANDSGDARRALDLLRIAADIAERNGDSKVTEAHARSARDRIELDAVLEVIKTLPAQSKTVLMAIVKGSDHGSITLTTGEVFTSYKDLCGFLDLPVLTQRRVADLISELDMLGMIHARVKSFGRNGRTKEIELSISGEVVCVLSSDDLFKPLSGFKKKQMTLM
ncbi:MAG: orc1/cdc6 family replication initiation protein [Candidatus Methanoplasma sp.]|jgi:cell division control protein 6|nr:orc1/cdc6 family replication initiation protein [Candidatus Methanoplasma sp.]